MTAERSRDIRRIGSKGTLERKGRKKEGNGDEGR
jgi:hypothetical protein